MIAEKTYKPTFSIRCFFGVHRLYETYRNQATGSGSTGYACYRCRRKWDWYGKARPIDHTGY